MVGVCGKVAPAEFEVASGAEGVLAREGRGICLVGNARTARMSQFTSHIPSNESLHLLHFIGTEPVYEHSETDMADDPNHLPE